jgi:hypothetical protein
MAENGRVPIRESAGHAVRFAVEQWRPILAVAAISALVQGASFLLLGLNLIWLVIMLVSTAAVTAALVALALDGPAGMAQRIVADTARIIASSAIIGFFMAIIVFLIIYVAMSVLIAPFAAEAKAAAEDQVRMAEIMSQAIESQPNVLLWAGLIGAVILFVLTTRFYLVAPASVDLKRIVVFNSWTWTRGNVMRIIAARLILLLPALFLTGAVQTLIALATGAPNGDPVQLAAMSQSNVLGFSLFYAGAAFTQIALYSSLEAGLSTYLYRGLKPAAAQQSAA